MTRSAGTVGWGILATGGIARAFTRDLKRHGHRVVAVGSRSPQAARSFADEFEVPRAHGTYGELIADPDVDVVYVATPHTFHAANALAAFEGGKHVLVEKPFTINAAEARLVVQAARAKGLLVMEAMWTRFLPHMAFIRSVVASGRIGRIRWVHADHTQRLSTDPLHRLNNPQLGGGALLDLGVYPLSFAHDLLGMPSRIAATATLSATGVDSSVATVLHYESGAISTSFSSSETRGPNTAVVLGTAGRIDLEPTWYGPTVVNVRDSQGQVVDRFDRPVSGRGMHYQAAEVERQLASGQTESALMPPEESVAVMVTMDEIRRAVGVRYPQE